MMRLSHLFSLFFTASVLAADLPTVTVKNGTLQGHRSPQWSQDFFLGIPFAEPPVGDLRFRWPQPYASKYDGVRNASQYGYSCYQYGSNFDLSEDCLTLNVIRPVGYENESLPVLLWIYGGGLTTGSSADPQYNMSGIVKTASDFGQPFIGVSINYRLGVWGFLQHPSILNEGSSNAGLLDQRMAMQYVQENIAAFGGDPKRVTIWGESAGAQSIALHLHSFGGRDDGLYSAAILESGGPTGASLNTLPFYLSPFENLTRTVGCWDSKNQLGCLRSLTSEQLYNSNYTVVWNPLVDGMFLTGYPSQLASEGKFVRVPIISGANTDEGVSFSTTGLDNETAIFNNLLYWRNYALSPPSIRRLLELYPNDPVNEPPYDLGTDQIFPNYGLQWRRSAAIGGDLVMISGRRKTCEQYVKGGVSNVYSYRFDTPLWNASAIQIPVSVYHFVNVVFSFQNISGALGPLPEYQHYKDLSQGIGRAYASFVSNHQPNGAGNGTGLPVWPKYDVDDPQEIVLNASHSFIEADTYRNQGIAFINSIDRELLA